MKAFLLLLLATSIIPVSILTMMLGWGLEVENWGWIAFGYTWMFVPMLVSSAVK